jgi:hypothetical protein
MLDIIQVKLRVDLSEILMLEVFEDVASSSQVRAFDYIQYFDNIGMI